MDPQPQDIVELSIDALNPRGYGLSTFNRPAPLPPLQVESAHTVVGDTVRVEMRKKMRGVRKGRLLDVIQPSADRVKPECKHVGVCGGCCWQQMNYQSQLKEKQGRVQAVFPGETLQPIIPAVSTFRYRNKMEFTFSENKAGMRYLGLMIAQAEPYVYNTEECFLCNPWFTQVLDQVRIWWEASGLKAFFAPKEDGTLRYITLREALRTGQKMVILNISGGPEFAPTRAQLDAFVASVQITVPDASIFLRIHQTKKGKPTQFFEMHLAGPDHIVEELHLSGGKLSFKISPISFFQPNTMQAERLYDEAMKLIAPLNPTTVFDLYCGTGTLGMASSRLAKNVIGVELSPEAVLDAEENLKRNGITNCTFLQGDVGKVLTHLIAEKGFQVPDVVIVDPPRAGLDALAIQHLKTLKAKAILYISCNPLTQGENVKELIQAGYSIKVLQPVDQFPHTFHIENIALLVR
jgi:23S rRNA (uracil1939-C5)-methyltransferase